MAETFLAVQRGAAGFEQRVCVKFILPTLRDDAGFNAMFLREATIAASLRHSNIVGVIDVDQERGYIVLELVDGVDLRGLLNAAPNHRLPPNVVALIALELAKALAYAHGRTRQGEAAGIVHRDISPSNVLVSYAGEIKLADFGIAKAIHNDNEPQSQTVKGKLCYMSPEQTRNETLDGRSDLFALGIVCYELLAGHRPFDGQSDTETILRLNQGQHTPLIEAAPDVPGGLAVIVERLLEIDIKRRYESADAVIDALLRCAPQVTTYRELGALARHARPHETVSTQDIEHGDSQPHPLKTGRDSRRPSSAPRAAMTFGTEDDARSSGVTRALVAPSRTQTSTTRVSRRAWSALGLSVTLFVGVAAAWYARQGESLVRPKPEVAAVVPATPPPSAASGSVPQLVNPGRVDQAHENAAPVEHAAEAAPTPQPVAAASDTQAPAPAQVEAASAPATPALEAHASGSGSKTPRAPSGQATLRVGTVPLGQVWIDGKVAGWSPVVVQVSAGRHSVAGGSDAPQVSKELRLRAGERRQLVLNLEDVAAVRSSATNSDATSFTAGR